MFDVEKLFAQRIGGKNFGKDTTVYKFAKIKNSKVEFKKNNPDIEILDFGVGEHDGIAPEEIRETLKTAIDKPENRGYADNGILSFQQAAARYVNRNLGTKIPEDEDAAKYITHGIGSKGILSLVPLAFINPEDTTIMTTPGYPVLGTHTEYLGGRVIKIPLEERNGFLPDLEKLENIVAEQNYLGHKVKLVCFNYPNNPTGANATPKFWNEGSKLAHKYNFIIAHDAAYGNLIFDEKPNGILQADGGMECGLGMYSLSKEFNSIGLRIAFVAGNPKLISAYSNVKDNSDSGQFKAIQQAGITALDNPKFKDAIVSKYKRRLDTLIPILNKNGFDAKMPGGSFFLYVKAPTGTKNGKKFSNGEEATKYLLEEHGISTVPWDDAGNYLRFSVTFDANEPYKLEGSAEKDARVFNELEKRLSKANLTF